MDIKFEIYGKFATRINVRNRFLIDFLGFYAYLTFGHSGHLVMALWRVVALLTIVRHGTMACRGTMACHGTMACRGTMAAAAVTIATIFVPR